MAMTRPRRFNDATSMTGAARSGGFDPDHRPLRLAARHFLEAGLVVHRLGPEPHGIVAGVGRPVDRISLDQLGALLLGIGNGALEERPRHALAAMLRRHHEADD